VYIVKLSISRVIGKLLSNCVTYLLYIVRYIVGLYINVQ